MFQNIILEEYHGTFHDKPLTKRFILFVNLQKQSLAEEEILSTNLCLKINWHHCHIIIKTFEA